MKPDVSTTVDNRGNPIFEYRGQVDFRLVTDWQVMSFMEERMAVVFALALADTKLAAQFEISSLPLETNDRRLVLHFIPKCMKQTDSDQARKSLLRLLTRLKLPIIWKEGKTGYDINKSGRIHRFWRLNSVYSTES